MKILVTDIFFRKSFDIINIFTSHYKKDDIIFTLPLNSRSNKFKLKCIYSISDFCLLRANHFENDLAEIAKKYKNQKIIYIPVEENTTLKFLSFIKYRGNLNFEYLLPSLFDFKLSRNKKNLNLFCEDKNIPCPKNISESTIKNKKFEFPIIKKPIHGSGSNGIVFIDNEVQLNKCVIDFKNEFVQERLRNPKDVKAGFYLCKEGEILSYYSHKRIRTYPESGGVSVYSKAENNQAIKTLGANIIKELNWSGFIMIEYLYDSKDNCYKLIEINPRLWGSIMLSEFCNANFLTSYVKSCLNDEISKKKIETNSYIRWVFPYDFIYWTKHYSNPFKFFKKQKNTCYINFSYTSLRRSFLFVIFSYFNFKNIKNLFS